MRTSASVITLAFLLAFPQTAKATPFSIGFQEVQPLEAFLNFYNGGFGSLGTGPGPNLGVTFTSQWVQVQPDVYGSPTGASAGISSTSTMSLAVPFSGPFSFYYDGGALTVNFFDGANGSGNFIGQWNLPSAGVFIPTGAALPAFQSAVFISPGANRIDALTFGALVIPEPGTFVLSLFSLGLLAALTRRN